ncbi:MULTISPECIES: helix-turn-helix domain-containing protein [Limnospira]|jgi:transcriptional regulator with XRE-family HTH domain|uniref:XRE family transcriptional regulator n=3 Tax=Sirenicapillariaceae TaxID=2934961 RepID=A0A5M3TBJ0_LIMPL|nr:helix-turn-helix domain-containing protein [Arthrospira platensis]KDR55688.1 XRE family transcriptional regulator [Arthrospira platensis str. Paraca]MBD2573204.1 helix-turn-helix domain-containing protein [Arthrospira platensis FACHB-971]MBD2670745.1 helix-turn-helix domain-containing protein [Arthrospira platensis FACHB-439]MBD2710302.1 helix-turn-helix domain-containing protein [Arthrospira platensis FACHB-835]MDF2209431.1 helix-turn-helix domain-containing protein [Arthrospira platensis 
MMIKPMLLSETNLQDIPQLLRQLREDLELSQAELAQFLGVSPQTINRWENGHSQPSAISINLMQNKLSSLDAIKDIKTVKANLSQPSNGLRQADVARILNVSFQRVQTIRKRHYIEFTWDNTIDAWVTSREEVQRYIDNKGKRRKRTIDN